MASSSSSSSSRQLKHQVFLSFRGEDTRYNFTSHLHKALKDKGINVFLDEETLERGEELSKELLKAIASSYISIIVLSVDYASSKSCLAELSEIMHLKRNEEQIALPIFYHVEPSDVRNLGGSFKTSFDEHESKRPDEVQRWKTAFAEVGNLIGWHIKGGTFDRSETEYIEGIVKVVIKNLNSKFESSSGELVGIDDQKETILRLIGQEDTRAIGIWGMGGIGKTTLAEAVYLEVIAKFDGHWFLQNVRDKLEKQGMESLRNEFFSKLLNDDIHIDTPSKVYTVIQDRLHNRRLFAVLDDVNDSEQIDCFCVKHFGQGSKILVTSRDKQVLENGVDQIHGVKGLNRDDSLELFSNFAFKLFYPVADFLDLSNKFVEYAQGSPLALKVLGSNLYLKPMEVWESALYKLKDCPEPKIIKILKISFNGLDDVDQNIFLDIACFFNGNERNFAVKFLSGCYKGARCGISSLVDKCLLNNCLLNSVNGRFYITMHDLLEEMGMDIVRQESKDRGKRSRLWRPKDVYDVLKYNKGTESIEGIMLDMSQIDALQLCPTVFENMHNLRFLMFYFLEFKMPCNKWLHADQVDHVSLPDELRCLWWDYYPFKSLSSKFNPRNLVVLILRHGNMEQLWNEDHQDLVNLSEIDLSDCKNLRKIPNLSGAINLESLCCHGCESLVELPCLNHLTSLELLDLTGCLSLVELPCLNHLTSLKELDLSRFESLVELPCLNHLRSLKKLKLHGCESLVKLPCFNHLTSLELLVLSGCLSLVKLPCFNHLTSLELLDLTGCLSLDELPCLNHLTSLELLYLTGCKSLVELPCLNHLTSLELLVLTGCKSLVELPCFNHLTSLGGLVLTGCESLVELPCLNHLTSLKGLELEKCYKLKKFPEVPHFCWLNLQNTGIEDVPDSIEHFHELQKLDMSNSRVKDVSSNISKLKSLYTLNLSHCPVTKFPEIPSGISALILSETQIEEVPSSIGCLNNLWLLDMSGSSIQNLQCSIDLHGCQNFTELNSVVPSSISRFKNLSELNMTHCKSLKLLSELPPGLRYLNVHDCTSLEKVSFTDQYPDQLKHFYDALIFSNCFCLNQDSVDNIVENAMRRIESQAKLSVGIYPDDRKNVFCCLSGNEISANKFTCQSTNSSIDLKIGPNSCSGSRFLVFALCLVVNLNQCHKYDDIGFICEYQLKATGGHYEKFKSVRRWGIQYNYRSIFYKSEYIGDHVLILFNDDMVKKDEDYEEASFKFYIKKFDSYEDEGTEVDDIKVEKCGVHVFYVDAESNTDNAVESNEKFNSDEMGTDESNENFDSKEDANIEKVHDDSTRPGQKRSLSNDGKGEGEGGPKRLK